MVLLLGHAACILFRPRREADREINLMVLCHHDRPQLSPYPDARAISCYWPRRSLPPALGPATMPGESSPLGRHPLRLEPTRAMQFAFNHLRPAAVILTRTTSIVLPPVLITSRSAVASPARTRPASIGH